MFIDFEKLHEQFGSGRRASSRFDEVISGLYDAVRRRIGEERGSVCFGVAYADFSRFNSGGGAIQKALYLLGIEPRYVTGESQKSCIDQQLTIDVVTTLHVREDVDTIVLVVGDRDYLPLAYHLKRLGRAVIVAAPREAVPAELLREVGEQNFIDLSELTGSGTSRSAPVEPGATPAPQFNPVREVPHDVDLDTLEIIEQHFGQYEEIYLTPLLRKLSEELGDVDDHDPKTIVGDLEDAGAVRLEKRKGFPYDYTVLIVNPDHPDVRSIRESINGEKSDYDYEGGEEYPDEAEPVDEGEDLYDETEWDEAK